MSFFGRATFRNLGLISNPLSGPCEGHHAGKKEVIPRAFTASKKQRSSLFKKTDAFEHIDILFSEPGAHFQINVPV